MSSLQFTERTLLEKILGMKTGYVSDFSDRTIQEFVLEKTGIDLYTEPYEANGTSKANRIRTFWQIESDEVTANLIEALLDYASREKSDLDRELTAQEERQFKDAHKIVQRLIDEPGPNKSSLSPKEKFARFKNQILGGTVLRDGKVWAEVLGDVDFEFWRNIHETEPYLYSTSEARVDSVTKGKVILERMEKETSPKRFAEMLQAVYEALAVYSGVPKNLGDSMWLTYVHRLQAEREATGFTELEIKWISEPETAFTREQPVERYSIPGVLQITYTGENWGTEQSQQILENGFTSGVLKRSVSSKNTLSKSKNGKPSWWERPMGIVALMVVAGVIVAGIVFLLHWN